MCNQIRPTHLLVLYGLWTKTIFDMFLWFKKKIKRRVIFSETSNYVILTFQGSQIRFSESQPHSFISALAGAAGAWLWQRRRAETGCVSPKPKAFAIRPSQKRGAEPRSHTPCSSAILSSAAQRSQLSTFCLEVILPKSNNLLGTYLLVQSCQLFCSFLMRLYFF